MEITEERVREIIREELGKQYVCVHSKASYGHVESYSPIGVILTKELILRWNSEHSCKAAAHTG